MWPKEYSPMTKFWVDVCKNTDAILDNSAFEKALDGFPTEEIIRMAEDRSYLSQTLKDAIKESAEVENRVMNTVEMVSSLQGAVYVDSLDDVV